MSQLPFSFANLPDGVLVQVFEELSLDGRIQGGEVVEWRTNHHLSQYMSVCRSWVRPVQAVLYRSIAIRGEAQSRQLLRVDPALLRMVRSLIIGLHDDLECMKEENGQAEESQMVVQVLLACAGVLHLQVRPLHSSVRTALLTSIKSRSLLSLVLAPCVLHGSKWSRGVWYASDHGHILLPTLRHLEIDFWTSTPAHLAPPNPIPLPAYPIPLVELRLASDIPDVLLFALLVAAGPTLEFIDIYLEVAPSIDEIANALSHCTHLAYLRYMSNPIFEQLSILPTTVPLFDRLLPRLEALTSLSIAATDISNHFLKLLPPRLEELEIQSLSGASTFFFHQSVLDDLTNLSVPIHLNTLTVRDIEEVWEPDEVDAVAGACMRRGVEFVFLPDGDAIPT